jgi:trimeric autotransporter adhesin
VSDVLPSFEAGYDYPIDGKVEASNLKRLVENAAPRANLIKQRVAYAPDTGDASSAQVLLRDGETVYKSNKEAWLNLEEDVSEGGRVALGKDSGRSGLYNVFVGQASGQDVSGNFNTTVGALTLSKVGVSSENTAVGSHALADQEGDDTLKNTAVGNQALRGNKSGANSWIAHDNVAIGVKAARELIKGDYNVAVGNHSLEAGDETTHCVAVGNLAMTSATAGVQSVAVGTGAMQFSTVPVNSIALGVGALRNSLEPSSNVAIGTDAGESSTSDQNVYVGTEAGKYLTNGQNVAIGWKAMGSTTVSSHANCVAIGANATTTRSNQVALGGTQTHVKLPVLPTSASGLSVGELYVDGGVVKQAS